MDNKPLSMNQRLRDFVVHNGWVVFGGVMLNMTK